MADFDLKKFDLEHWWKMVAAAGATVLVAAVAVKFVPAMLLGLGLLAIGCGEWMMHPERTVPYREGLQSWLVTTHARYVKAPAVALDVLGALLCIIGVFRMLFA
jgi:hypothetical protein